MLSDHALFQIFKLYELELSNRIVMAPLTRCRGGIGDCATALQAEYYQQRASAGLIISEASQISQQGKGYLHTPGIYNQEQITGWKQTTEAVCKAKGKIFCQLWHVGRISHPSFQEYDKKPVAPSAIQPKGLILTESGMQEYVTPRALETNEIIGIIQQYVHAARCAKEAGFNGIEIHAANGYLLDQFLRTSSNQRRDQYGGRIQNRIRLIVEVTEALTSIWPSHQIGIRLSPISTFNDMSDLTPMQTFSELINVLNTLNLGYIHCIEGTARENRSKAFDFVNLRRQFKGFYIANNMYTLDMARLAIDNKHADLICFGRPFIANPDLVFRLQSNLTLIEAPKETWYGGNEVGYTDWPNALK